jgi:hypothetical protein
MRPTDTLAAVTDTLASRQQRNSGSIIDRQRSSGQPASAGTLPGIPHLCRSFAGQLARNHRAAAQKNTALLLEERRAAAKNTVTSSGFSVLCGSLFEHRHPTTSITKSVFDTV